MAICFISVGKTAWDSGSFSNISVNIRIRQMVDDPLPIGVDETLVGRQPGIPLE